MATSGWEQRPTTKNLSQVSWRQRRRLMSRLYDVIKTAARVTNNAIVMFSTGKDSVVTLDLCAKYFKNFQICFMYYVKGLAFQEKTLAWYENKFGKEILRIPHFDTSYFLKDGYFTPPDYSVPILKITDCWNYARDHFGIDWIISGETVYDSLQRRAMIRSGGTINTKTKRIHPLAEWKKSDVLKYIKAHHLRTGVEQNKLGFTTEGLEPLGLAYIKENHPDDFEKMKKVYPLIEAVIKRHEYQRELRSQKNPAVTD